VTLVPTFLVIHTLGWVDSYQGLAGPLLIDAFGVFLMRQFMLQDPVGLRRRRRGSDGAGEAADPLVDHHSPVPGGPRRPRPLARLPRQLGSFLWPLVVVSRDEFRTYPLGLVRFGDDYGNPPTEQMAIAVLATIPIFLLFLPAPARAGGRASTSLR